MATVKYSVSAYTADGTTTDYLITWDYLDDDHITVEVDGVSNDDPTANHTFVKLNDTTVRVTDGIGGAIAAGSQIQIRRNTPITTRPISFADGSALLASDLNKNSDYLLYAMQEALDEVDFTVQYQEEAEGFKDATEALRDETQVLRDATQVDTNAADAHRIAAALSETNAATSATNAATSETNAATSETNAATSETNAASSATAALASEGAAATSATNAATSETNAAASAAAAAGSEAGVAADAATATAEAAAAATSEANALIYKNNASTSATNAATSESNSASSASAAALSATNAAGSATAAGISEGNAQTYATNSQASAAAASTAELNAEASEVSAATSATNAAASETSVADNATAAATSEANALTYASNASTSASQAAASAQSIAGYDLGNIAATISDTAVDIFVYDTRKDSDGGAWRKRTQHTSWYNETLSTSTRGSRREFPSVAVIVAESNKVTIYDGDDPSLPMWMVFNKGGSSGSYTAIGNNTEGGDSLFALNAKIATGNPSAYSSTALHIIDFISDNSIHYTNSTTQYTGQFPLPLDKRNVSGEYVLVGLQAIVSVNVNDVAMTVLPNAPIDASTGLPVPTIAVATDGGVSVIKDDGTVVDITHTASTNNGATDISFDGNQISYATQQSGSSTNYWRKAFIDIPSADVTGSYTHNISGMTVYDARGTSSNSGVALNTNSNLGDATNDIKAAVHDAVGFTNKLTLLDVDYYSDAGTPSESGSMVAYASSDYNTGWMNGDIKLATLSDTDDTNVTGSELVTNGTFDTDVSGWSNNPTELLTWNSSGYADINRNGGSSQGQCYQYITTEIGKSYVVAVDVLAVSHGFQVYYDGNSAPSTSGSTVTNTTGTFYWFFTAQSTNTKIDLSAVQSSTATASVDNVSVKLAEADRSVNGLGLQVFGTVQKEAVATGADLVQYNGFNSSNYLEQPYNSDLDFGSSDDFCIMGWFKATSTTQILMSKSPASSIVSPYFEIQVDPTNVVWVGDNNTGRMVTPSAIGPWSFVAVSRINGTNRLFLNGELKATASSTEDYTHSNADTLRFGQRQDGYGGGYPAGLALWRISATAPSPEQIKKIYEDEKVLFQDGAQATLYGSSDAVTALAYDDSTELLHVGTSAGRSVFQGLKRVDNTTTAVGAAISASNSMVAED